MPNDLYSKGGYIKNNPTWHVEDSPWKADQIMHIIEKNKIKYSSICEVGCGAGEILAQLQKKMPSDVHLNGFEISPDAYNLCKTRENDKLKFYFQDILEQKEGFYDIILAIDVIEHIEDYFNFLRKIKTKAKYVIFHIPLDLYALSIIRVFPLLERREKVGHINYFSRETALAALKDMGYKIIDEFYTACPADFEVKFFKSRILNLTRKIFFPLNPNLTLRVLGGYSLMVLTE